MVLVPALKGGIMDEKCSTVSAGDPAAVTTAGVGAAAAEATASDPPAQSYEPCALYKHDDPGAWPSWALNVEWGGWLDI